MGGMDKMQRRLEFIVSFILITLTVHLTSEHVCMLQKRPDSSHGDDMRWSIPNEEICACQMVITLTFLSECDQRDEGSDMWFIDDPHQITMQHNWKKNILDELLGRTQFCADECEDGTDNCDTNAVCINTLGSYNCQCNTGYSGNGVTCTGIDECTNGDHACASNAQCINTASSYICNCNEGYSGDGFNCTDVNECTEGPCAATASCNNTVGSFTCQCDDGYNGDGIICTDVNECAENPCASTASCNNTVGSFVCQCDDGYIGDGFTCVVCSDYLGMENGDIPNANILASSADVAASHARLNFADECWRALETDTNIWIQAKLVYTTYVSGVIVQGDGNNAEPDYIKTFKVSTSASSDMTNKVFIKNPDESPKTFTGNNDATTPVTRSFPEPIYAQTVRIHCLTRHGDRWRLRFEIIGCKI